MRRKSFLKILLLVCVFCLSACSDSASDLQTPADTSAKKSAEPRIVSLAPHLAELVFAVGAGDMLVGVSAYTDYPAAAVKLPVVGDAFGLDQESLAVIKPDVLLAWKSGTPAHVVDEIRARGYRVEVIATTSIDDISLALQQIGEMTGHADDASVVAHNFAKNMQELANRYAESKPINVFYQVATRPLYTVNAEHYVSELIEICGGTNVFADLGGLAPLIGVEAVLQRNPEVILASSDAGPDAFLEWQRWPELAAIRYTNQFLMPADEIGRATPRLLLAAQAMCDALEQGRSNRETSVE